MTERQAIRSAESAKKSAAGQDPNGAETTESGVPAPHFENLRDVRVISEGPDKPRIELIAVDGRIARIHVTCPSGDYFELECVY